MQYLLGLVHTRRMLQQTLVYPVPSCFFAVFDAVISVHALHAIVSEERKRRLPPRTSLLRDGLSELEFGAFVRALEQRAPFPCCATGWRRVSGRLIFLVQ